MGALLRNAARNFSGFFRFFTLHQTRSGYTSGGSQQRLPFLSLLSGPRVGNQEPALAAGFLFFRDSQTSPLMAGLSPGLFAPRLTAMPLYYRLIPPE